MSSSRTKPPDDAALLARVRAAARQEQFLEVVSAEEARTRFARHLDLAPLPAENVSLAQSLGRVLAHDVVAVVDAPAFDRSNVDGFAVRAADTLGASDAAPKVLRLNAEVIACGQAPDLAVAPGTATTIATGGMIPRGADAVVMIEHTELLAEGAPQIELRRAAGAGQRLHGQTGDRLFPHILELSAERNPDTALRAGHQLDVGRGGRTGSHQHKSARESDSLE